MLFVHGVRCRLPSSYAARHALVPDTAAAPEEGKGKEVKKGKKGKKSK